MHKVSVIVPVYNCENYLERCMNSLINQSLEDIEIIAVNDGSTDGSLDILTRYQQLDNRIKIIDKENTGVSDSRNKGIEASAGKYIAFVDSDDWIELNMLEDMYIKAEDTNSEVVICSYMREFGNHSKIKIMNLDEDIIYEGDRLKELHRRIIGPLNEEFKEPESLDSLGSSCTKLYRSNIIKINKIKFVDLKEIGTAEDTLFNFELFNYIEKVVFINKPYYHYWKQNSKSVTSAYNKNLTNQWKNLFRYMDDIIKHYNLDENFSKALENRICVGVLALGLHVCKKNNNLTTINRFKNVKSILEDKIIKEAYENFDLSYFPIHWKIFYFFNKKRWSFLSYLMLSSIELLRTRV